jgi:hypothetical protein
MVSSGPSHLFFDESEQGSAIVRDSHSAFRQERKADVIARMKADGLPRAFGPRNDEAGRGRLRGRPLARCTVTGACPHPQRNTRSPTLLYDICVCDSPVGVIPGCTQQAVDSSLACQDFGHFLAYHAGLTVPSLFGPRDAAIHAAPGFSETTKCLPGLFFWATNLSDSGHGCYHVRKKQVPRSVARRPRSPFSRERPARQASCELAYRIFHRRARRLPP